jgi:signal transduction histidine kinase
MTLVNRVSAFFLAALAATLGVSSAMFYFTSRRHLQHEFDARLDAALNPIVAAIEAEPGGVKWQPAEHEMGLDAADGPDAARWVVVDEQSRIVAQSHNLQASDSDDAKLLRFAARGRTGRLPADGDVHDSIKVARWRVKQHRVVAPPANADDVDDEPRSDDEFDELTVTVGKFPAGLDADLRRLAWQATLLPLVTWLAAAAAGRQFVRRALAPVGIMAKKARTMAGGALAERLPVSATGDELAEFGEAFNSLLDRRQRAFEEQRRFTGDAAHQLRTPLTVLGGQIDVALRRDRDADEYRRTLGVLHDEVAEMRKIVDSLLFIARADGDAALPDREPIALDQWLPKYLERWNDNPRRGDLSLELGTPATISASAPLLAQLLDNLVSNACKYSPPGTPITIAAGGVDGAATIAVTDRGPGIAPADQAAVFEPFIRTAEARQRGVAGTGLGLAIAARIASALGGRITLASAPGSGSTFAVHFKGATEG